VCVVDMLESECEEERFERREGGRREGERGRARAQSTGSATV